MSSAFHSAPALFTRALREDDHKTGGDRAPRLKSPGGPLGGQLVMRFRKVTYLHCLFTLLRSHMGPKAIQAWGYNRQPRVLRKHRVKVLHAFTRPAPEFDRVIYSIRF